MMSDDVPVWDFFVRFFHWSLMGVAFICLMTEDDLLDLHVIAGYAVGLLIAARVVWGLVGPKYARFSSFIFSPVKALSYLKDLIRLRAKRYLGHSPAGGAMVIAILLVLVLAVVSGVASYAAEEGAGPLAAYFAGADIQTRGLLAMVHQATANLLWLLILLHIAGVLLASYAHKENLVRAMITGFKKRMSNATSR